MQSDKTPFLSNDDDGFAGDYVAAREDLGHVRRGRCSKSARAMSVIQAILGSLNILLFMGWIYVYTSQEVTTQSSPKDRVFCKCSDKSYDPSMAVYSLHIIQLPNLRCSTTFNELIHMMNTIHSPGNLVRKLIRPGQTYSGVRSPVSAMLFTACTENNGTRFNYPHLARRAGVHESNLDSSAKWGWLPRVPRDLSHAPLRGMGSLSRRATTADLPQKRIYQFQYPERYPDVVATGELTVTHWGKQSRPDLEMSFCH